MGKLFPHPVGVFCTIPNPPQSRIIPKIIFFRKTAISSNIPYYSLLGLMATPGQYCWPVTGTPALCPPAVLLRSVSPSALPCTSPSPRREGPVALIQRIPSYFPPASLSPSRPFSPFPLLGLEGVVLRRNSDAAGSTCSTWWHFAKLYRKIRRPTPCK